MFVRSCWPLFLTLLSLNVFAKPAAKQQVSRRADDPSSHFVSQQDGKLMVNGRQALSCLSLFHSVNFREALLIISLPLHTGCRR
jgi:hypothetical protein